jgi:hypothetical protein
MIHPHILAHVDRQILELLSAFHRAESPEDYLTLIRIAYISGYKDGASDDGEFITSLQQHQDELAQ